ncbi:pentatricopeptide repeat-containing protein At5g16640, mitochondrial-like [Papaver somniferum]|uniref:pentatricopeptide repeat-containing protein At5g16640, mitochondrial-like n=1 Tax=Papaver somniferum TaxID=3469 RepID=UPI000E6F816F|nr:pentatricopeptide repeat-containing protein At5g16640, mitochondrial-like [Papaver somniferum]
MTHVCSISVNLNPTPVRNGPSNGNGPSYSRVIISNYPTWLLFVNSCYNQYHRLQNYAFQLIMLARYLGKTRPSSLTICSNSVILMRNYYGNNSISQELENFVRDECKSGNIKKLDDGLRYFNILISVNPFPSSHIFSLLLGSLSKIECYSEVIMLYKKMNMIGIEPHLYTFNVLVNCYCQLVQVDHGFCILGETLKRGLNPDVCTFTVLIKGMCMQGKIFLALQVFDKMTEIGIQPDVVMFGTVVTGLCKTGEIGLAMEFPRMMAKWNCSPNVVVYSSLINGLCSANRFHEAKRLLDDMTSRGITANVTSYNCIIRGHCVHNQLKEARQYFYEMLDRGILPNTVTFNMLIDYFCKQGMLENAHELFVLMCKGLEPSVISYNILIDGYCKSRKLHEAMKLFKNLKQNGFKPTVVTYNILLAGLYRDGRVGSAQTLFMEMKSFGLSPSEVTYGTMLDGLCKNGHLEKAIALYKTAERTYKHTSEFRHSRKELDAMEITNTICCIVLTRSDRAYLLGYQVKQEKDYSVGRLLLLLVPFMLMISSGLVIAAMSMYLRQLCGFLPKITVKLLILELACGGILGIEEQHHF